MNWNVDDLVNYSRPSIDVLFESAAEAFKEKLLGIVLTGANHDGAIGSKRILQYGGRVFDSRPQRSGISCDAYVCTGGATRQVEVYTLKMIADFLRHEVSEMVL